MGALNILLTPEERRSIDSSTLTGSFQLVGSVFSHPIILLKIVNVSDEDVDISYNGSTVHDIVPANGFTLYDANTNRYRDNEGMQWAVNQGVWARGTAGTGNIYVVAFYAG